ncbi:MAG: ABC transporter ATP-binding protein [Chloroherpetonaceae bacterium]|nr:ABC transporter ATP-binding protein [Chloroherpetonaceae bacterium]MDW8436537.1 ABC transporter ATP-binding protein [Chloroherpetonaceae bacterium]
MSIVISNLVYSYSSDSKPVLNIPSFEVKAGESLALVGKSGSGKSTLLNVIAGIVAVGQGSLKVNGVELVSLSEPRRDDFRAANIGYVFQTFNLLQGLTAFENVLVAMTFAKKTSDAKSRAKSLLERVGLGEKLHRKPRELSVGEQQRVAIARAIANEPSIILADEPTANLDEQNSQSVLSLLKEVASEKHRVLLLVTHEKDVAACFPRSLDIKTINHV